MCNESCRRRRLLVFASSMCLGVLLFAVSYVSGVTKVMCGADCETISCGNSIQWDGTTYAGCSKKSGGGCEGKCKKCTGSTVANHCVKSSGEKCDYDPAAGSTSCGQTTYYPCTGDKYPDCSCDTSKPESSSDSCSLGTCIPDD